MNILTHSALKNELHGRKLSAAQSKDMKGLMTLKELKTCLFMHMRGQSRPGLDGFSKYSGMN